MPSNQKSKNKNMQKVVTAKNLIVRKNIVNVIRLILSVENIADVNNAKISKWHSIKLHKKKRKMIYDQQLKKKKNLMNG